MCLIGKIGARFANVVIDALVTGKPGKECAYVASDVIAGCDYFASVIEFGVFDLYSPTLLITLPGE